MTGPVTPLDEATLTALVEAAEAATPGPWLVSDDPAEAADLIGCDDAHGDDVFIVKRKRPLNEHAAVDGRADATYIAAASPDKVAALVEEVRALRAENGEMRALNRQLENDVERLSAVVGRVEALASLLKGDAERTEQDGDYDYALGFSVASDRIRDALRGADGPGEARVGNHTAVVHEAAEPASNDVSGGEER